MKALLEHHRIVSPGSLRRFDPVLIYKSENDSSEMFLVLNNWSGTRNLKLIRLLRLPGRFDCSIDLESARRLEEQANEKDLYYFYPDTYRLSSSQYCYGPRCLAKRLRGVRVLFYRPSADLCVEIQRRDLGRRILRRRDQSSFLDRWALDDLIRGSFEYRDRRNYCVEAAIEYHSLPVLRDLVALLRP